MAAGVVLIYMYVHALSSICKVESRVSMDNGVSRSTIMTTLNKEVDLFPDDLFGLSTSDSPWAVAHLRSRQEKAVARLLLEGGKPFYLPQMTQTFRRSGRTQVSHLPLFPGYIFLRRVEGLRETLWRTKAVASMLEVEDQAQLTAELRQIQQLQVNGAVFTPGFAIARGDAVRIVEGAFSGYSGVVQGERGALRLVVSVSMLRKSVTVEFPRELLARIPRREGLRGGTA